MFQNDFHNINNNGAFNPPNQTFGLGIIQKLVSAYKLWHEFLVKFPKRSKHTLGAKIDFLFLETIEFTLTAIYVPKPLKLSLIEKNINKIDLLKFFLQLSWETKTMDNKNYAILSEEVFDLGKIMGGWKKKISQKNPPYFKGGKKVSVADGGETAVLAPVTLEVIQVQVALGTIPVQVWNVAVAVRIPPDINTQNTTYATAHRSKKLSQG